MKKLVVIVGLALVLGCSSQKTSTTSKKVPETTPPKQVEFIDDNTYLLTVQSDDKSYGYDQSNPIKVGGVKDNNGPMNERRFLNGLLGPNGEEIHYKRSGSCCHFKTPNGLLNGTGLLDAYEVSWKGSSDKLTIYINMYDKGELKVPVGLTARKK